MLLSATRLSESLSIGQYVEDRPKMFYLPLIRGLKTTFVGIRVGHQADATATR
jgi:hypothetical protein